MNVVPGPDGSSCAPSRVHGLVARNMLRQFARLGATIDSIKRKGMGPTMSNFEIPVTDYMTSPAHVVGHQESLEQADRVMDQYNVSALGVIGDDGALIGVVSRTDLLRAGEIEWGEALRLPDVAVGTVATRPATTVDRAATIASAAKLMLKQHIHRVFVTSDEDVLGVLSTQDLMRVVIDVGCRVPVEEVATKSVVKIKTDDSLGLAYDRLDVSSKHGLVVVYGEWPVGVFAQPDALLARARSPKTPVEKAMDPQIVALPGNIPLDRAAAQALSLGARRILIVGNGVEGVVSGLDFARVMK